MEQSQEIPHLLWNLKVHYHLYKISHRFISWAKWIQFTPFHAISLTSILILFFHLSLGLPSGLFSLLLSQPKLTHLSSVYAACPIHLIIVDFIILIILWHARCRLTVNSGNIVYNCCYTRNNGKNCCFLRGLVRHNNVEVFSLGSGPEAI
jgi:hypothetical protein